MKNLIIFIFTFNTVFLNHPSAWAQSSDNAQGVRPATLKESLETLNNINRELRFADSKQQVITFTEAATKVMNGEPVYVANANTPQNYLIVSRTGDITTAKGRQLSLTVAKVVGQDVVSTSTYNLNLGNDLAHVLYKDLYGEKIEDQKTDTLPIQLKDGDGIHDSENLRIYCRIGKDPITGVEVRDVSIGAGPGNTWSFFALVAVGAAVMTLAHPRFNKSKIQIIGIFAIAIGLWIVVGALNGIGKQAGCK